MYDPTYECHPTILRQLRACLCELCLSAQCVLNKIICVLSTPCGKIIQTHTFECQSCIWIGNRGSHSTLGACTQERWHFLCPHTNIYIVYVAWHRIGAILREADCVYACIHKCSEKNIDARLWGYVKHVWREGLPLPASGSTCAA